MNENVNENENLLPGVNTKTIYSLPLNAQQVNVFVIVPVTPQRAAS